jgi:hypothetical protein
VVESQLVAAAARIASLAPPDSQIGEGDITVLDSATHAEYI